VCRESLPQARGRARGGVEGSPKNPAGKMTEEDTPINRKIPKLTGKETQRRKTGKQEREPRYPPKKIAATMRRGSRRRLGHLIDQGTRGGGRTGIFPYRYSLEFVGQMPKKTSRSGQISYPARENAKPIIFRRLIAQSYCPG